MRQYFSIKGPSETALSLISMLPMILPKVVDKIYHHL